MYSIITKIAKIKKLYSDINILKNEDGIDELGFMHIDIAEDFVHTLKDVWPLWISNKDKLTMQFIADTVKKMNDAGYITKNDLYTLEEKEISETFKMFENADHINESEEAVNGKYCISLEGKRRYIVPLVNNQGKSKRITDISECAKQDVEDYLNSKTKKYAYFDFNF